ncbi:MAG: hypothetical protein F4066_06590 [Chloroflexi bacterium]|nr:hypothetical protein [Chloroflexota bacterium]MYI04512.1 hypothetical protein [Chloroflexota bacterium]
MQARLRGRRLRNAALLVLVAAVVAIVGCDDDMRQQSEVIARQDQGTVANQPLKLTLSAPDTCDTERGRPISSSEEAPALRDVAEVAVRWHVEGGTPPYQVEIDGETRDATQEYARPREFGSASVSCALRTGVVSYEADHDGPFRQYTGDFLVDSGSKTIVATITDSGGRTGSATAGMYVTLSIEHAGPTLSAGERYLLNYLGTSLVLTVPNGLTLEFSVYTGEEGDGDDFSYSWVGAYLRYTEGDISAGIAITVELTGGGDFDPWSCPGEESRRYVSETADESQARRIHAAFDELIEKIQVLSIDSGTYASCLTAD